MTHWPEIIAVALLIALLAAGVAWRLAGAMHSSANFVGWTAVTNGNSYGAVVDPITGSFTFPVAPSSVHYVTKACRGLSGAKGLRLRFTVEADPGVQFLPMQLIGGVDTPVANSQGERPVLYFQRDGDDWSGVGKCEAFRWWATSSVIAPLAPGDYEITALFTDRWTAVETSNSDDFPEEFRAALTNAARVGFTFPGATGEGHGVTATGHATFTLTEFALI